MQMVDRDNMTFEEIAEHLPGRTVEAIKRRYYRKRKQKT